MSVLPRLKKYTATSSIHAGFGAHRHVRMVCERLDRFVRGNSDQFDDVFIPANGAKKRMREGFWAATGAQTGDFARYAQDFARFCKIQGYLVIFKDIQGHLRIFKDIL